MQNPTSSACRCVNCPGAACTCGCQTAATPQQAAASTPVCTCGPNCACRAAQSTCLCV